MTVGVVGLGYVGLATALGFAQQGERVLGFDVDAARLAGLRAGRMPLGEPGFAEALARHGGKGLAFADRVEDVIAASDAVFLCVGTPSLPGGAVDLAPLRSAVEACAPALRRRGRGHLVVKSTVPPGTTRDVLGPLLRGLGVPGTVHLSVNPEFLREGHAWEDFLRPDRIVLGCEDPLAAADLEQRYKPFDAPVVKVNPTTAEFIKYASNTLLATLVSFSNELAAVGEAVGDVDVARGFRSLALDRRWHGSPAAMAGYAYPGTGFGGSCLPKDARALVAAAEARGVDPELLRAVLAVNGRAGARVAAKVRAAARPHERVALLGLAFKPGSDDVRESPSAPIVQELLAHGYTDLVVHDPRAGAAFRAAHPGLPLTYATTMEQACAEAKAVAVLTAWPEYRRVREAAPGARIVDGRYML